MIGKTISHYRILEKIGGGGMGEVYKAEDIKLKRAVALKFLPPDLTRDEEARKRFIHEARAASALDHPNIGSIYEIDENDEGQDFIAMAYYDGETLKDKIDRGPLAVEDILVIICQVCEGLTKAHDKQIVHRDIKPGNVIVTNDGQVKIIDFGLAKLFGRSVLTKEGSTIGTIFYMSPEQTKGTDVDHRTDVWSLGVILYEMLTGKRPFEGDYEQAVVYSIANEQPEHITDLRPEIPSQLEKVVEKTLHKDPGKRYQTVGQMRNELRNLSHELKHGQLKSRSNLLRLSRSKHKTIFGATAAVLAFCIIALVYFWYGTDAKATPTSIAILPLRSLSDTTEQEWFTDSMTDALITDLAKIGGLRVISRSSVMRFKGTNESMPRIADALQVDYIIDGSILKIEDQVKISAQLINAPKDEYLWAADYERDFRDILKLQSEIAKNIVEQVKVKLTPEDRERLENVATVSGDVHELYLKGRYFLNKQKTQDDLWKSVDYFEHAIKQDPNYAPAYTGLASTYSRLANNFVAPHEAMPIAKQAAQKAIELDETLSDSHVALGGVLLIYDRNWSAAEAALRKAITLNPGSVDAHSAYSVFLTTIGKFQEAQREMELAMKLDPLSLLWRPILSFHLIMARQYDEAIRMSFKTLELEPDLGNVHAHLGLAFVMKGELSKAADSFDKAEQLSYSPLTSAMCAYGFAMTGQRARAEEKLKEIIEISKKVYICPYESAFVYIALGNFDEAFKWLYKALDQNSICVIFTKVDPRLDPIRNDPRFQKLLTDAGFNMVD